MAEEGAAQGTVVIAELQTAGRGRMGRSWHSPAGVNLYMTIILRPSMPLGEVPRLSLVAGVAAAEALETVAPGIVALKWPNDVWLRGRKAGGIIAEAVTDAAQGLDASCSASASTSISRSPTFRRSCATRRPPCVSRRAAYATVLNSLLPFLIASHSRYMEVEAAGFAAVRPAWERYSALTGRSVSRRWRRSYCGCRSRDR